jgi:hypothetical protein
MMRFDFEEGVHVGGPTKIVVGRLPFIGVDSNVGFYTMLHKEP